MPSRFFALKRLPLTVAVTLALGAGSSLAQEVVKIGYTGPLSGGAALYGKNVLNGLQLAAKEINAKGFDVKGKKYKVEIVPLDDKYAPAESAINARRLRQQHGVPVVFVPHSGGAFALQAFNQQENFLLMAYTSVPTITEKGNKLTMRIPPNFLTYIEPFIRSQMKYGKKLGMAPADHDYAKAWVAAFEPAWTKAGGAVVANNPMSYNKSADFYTGVSRVLESKPDVMFIGGPSEPTGLVAKQARELGFKGPFVIMDQAKMDEMARVTGGLQMLEGSIGTLPLTADERPGAKAFVAAYRASYGADSNPSSEASLNYTALHLVVQAMQLAGSVSEPAAIRAQLDAAAKALPDAVNPNDLNGVDEKGGSELNTVVGVVEGGKMKAMRLKSL
ncbi:ABC transporter substrate-binding protein [uncultured Aquabacterium sp.]|uniref:ABC transporter substrate-binding protein n=1 Tax=Aquabacterium sp. TaxID=1872578 RepID=UPI0025CCC59A|nr:ABC transporter substrate-binding protein [uncultured Aquabacterium sp.]